MAEALSQKSINVQIEKDLQAISTLDDATSSWLYSLHRIWNMLKKSAGVTQTLCEYFETAPNPYYSTLRILVNVNDFYHTKTKSSLSFTVIEDFANWIAPKKENFNHCLIIGLKIAAYRLLSKQKNMQLTKMVSDVYEFEKDKTYFIPCVQEHIENKKYKEAGQLVELLKLQSYFSDPKILILPLILQNKNTIAESVLKDHPDMQIKLITLLDDMLAPENNAQYILDKYIDDYNIPDVKIATFHTKAVSKLVARLAKLYNVPPETCPYLHKKRGEGALQFLIHKKYVDGSLSTDSFREMAKEAIGSEEQLQIHILKHLCNSGDVAEAYYFAQFYNVPKTEWPWYLTNYVQDFYHTGEGNSDNQDTWDEEEKEKFYDLSLPKDNIIIIDNISSFQNFLDCVLSNVDMVGIDSEWKPSFSIKKPELALIQIATHSNVYILDVTVLGNNAKSQWNDLAKKLFSNRDILKLGFGLSNDIKMMQESLPELSNIRNCRESCLDLYHVWRKLIEIPHFTFPHKGDENFINESLSKLVDLCFGKKLNKEDQFSNWEQRPLRETQIIYAALDAYCLIEIYNKLVEHCNLLNIPFYDICYNVHRGHAKSKPARIRAENFFYPQN